MAGKKYSIFKIIVLQKNLIVYYMFFYNNNNSDNPLVRTSKNKINYSYICTN